MSSRAQRVVLEDQQGRRVGRIDLIERRDRRRGLALDLVPHVGGDRDDPPPPEHAGGVGEDLTHRFGEVVVAGDDEQGHAGVCRGQTLVDRQGPDDGVVIGDIAGQHDRIEGSVLARRREDGVQTRRRVDLRVVGRPLRVVQMGIGQVQQPHGAKLVATGVTASMV